MTEIDVMKHESKTQQKKYIALYEVNKNQITTYYYINIVQFRIILRDMLQLLLAQNNGFQLHSSGVIKNRKAILFVGAHGAGKSTAAQLASSQFPIFVDDAVVIRQIKGDYYAFQTFEHEKNVIPKTSKRYRIQSVNFIYQNQDCYKKKIKNSSQRLQLLMKECWAADKKTLSKQIVTIQNFAETQDIFYDLFFSKQAKCLCNRIKD